MGFKMKRLFLVNFFYFNFFYFILFYFYLSSLNGKIGTTLNNDDEDDDNDHRINPRSGPILAVLIRSLLRSHLACWDDVNQ